MTPAQVSGLYNIVTYGHF